MTASAVLGLCALGCGARQNVATMTAAGDEITLYRDRALINQRIAITAARAGASTVTIRLPAGVGPGDVVITDRGELATAQLRIAGAVDDRPSAPPDGAIRPDESTNDPTDESADESPDAPPDEASDAEDRPPPPPVRSTPSDLELDVTAPHAGRFTVALGYTTDRLAWNAAYTMTTTASRDRAVVRGAIAVRNTGRVAFHAHTRVIDAELGAWRDRTAEQLGSAVSAVPPPIEPCDLGVVDLGDGETRIELGLGAAPRRLRSVLVYDPVGPGLDHTGAIPVSDPSIGVALDKPGQVSESFEIERDPHAPSGFPAGPVRLLERHGDGSLELLGEARLFEAATRVASVDTIPVGTAQGVIGHRERRDWAKSDDRRRFNEEFLITIDNARPRPIELVLREHLYRGQNWTLAYHSAPAVKEGPQQIALRTTVAAKGRAKVLYVVVYTW